MVQWIESDNDGGWAAGLMVATMIKYFNPVFEGSEMKPLYKTTWILKIYKTDSDKLNLPI